MYMRRKIHFLLLPVYAATFIFILFINGVFTAEVYDLANLFINVGFLIIMGILLFISIGNFQTVLSCVKEMDEQTKYFMKQQDTDQKEVREEYLAKKHIYSNTFLDEAFERYKKSLKKMNGYRQDCRLSDYINEDMMDHIAKNHFNSNLAGTMTGLGILGTFLGLSIGLTSFNVNNLLAVSDNMGVLIEGMKVAFHTSVYGILFSLIYSFIYKSIMAEVYTRLDVFLDEYDNFMAPLYENELNDSSAVVIYQAQMVNTMKEILELLKTEHREQLAGVERLTEALKDQFLKTMGQDLEKLGNILSEAVHSQENVADFTRQMETSTERLILANADLLDKMKGMQESQKKVSKDLLQQKDELEKTCIDLTKQVGSQLYAFDKMRKQYET